MQDVEVEGDYVTKESNKQKDNGKEIQYYTFSCICNPDFNICMFYYEIHLNEGKGPVGEESGGWRC